MNSIVKSSNYLFKKTRWLSNDYSPNVPYLPPTRSIVQSITSPVSGSNNSADVLAIISGEDFISLFWIDGNGSNDFFGLDGGRKKLSPREYENKRYIETSL